MVQISFPFLVGGLLLMKHGTRLPYTLVIGPFIALSSPMKRPCILRAKEGKGPFKRWMLFNPANN